MTNCSKRYSSVNIAINTNFLGKSELSDQVTIGYRYGMPGEPVILGDNFKIGTFCVIEDNVRIGNNALIDHHCVIYTGSRIGNDVKILYGARIYPDASIGHNCIIGGHTPDRIVIGNNVTFMGTVAHSYRNAAIEWDDAEEPSPVIKDGSIIGLNSLIVGGITIGYNCYIAAGEILRHDLPDNSVFLNGEMHPISKFRGFIKTRFH